jgi:predicted metal-binding membrane protein
MNDAPTRDYLGVQQSRLAWPLLLVVGVIAWIVTAQQAAEMGVGPGTMGASFSAFIGAWAVMMTAMMLPAIGGSARQVGGSGPAMGFAAGFLVPWSAYGGLAFAVVSMNAHLVAEHPEIARWLGVGVIALAGAFQLSPWKQRALDHCRMHRDRSLRITGAFWAGLEDGATCIGCCWLLMAVLVPLGTMNLAGMGALAVLIFAEKVIPTPRTVVIAAGVVLLAFAAIAAAHPAILHGAVAPMEMGRMPTGGM